MKRILVTGGAGFIGSALIRHLIEQSEYEVLNLDKLTYAANLESLKSVAQGSRYNFIKADISDTGAVTQAIDEFRPDAVMHLAAESHVDRSIEGPEIFIQTNIVGTFAMLTASLNYWEGLDPISKAAFRFHHVSTDEVFGELGPTGVFTEDSHYRPNSPYAASKASADHLVRAWGRTYGLPVVLSNCSNNYGPYHFPEKLIPLCIIKCLRQEEIPVYGTGQQVRDWLFVDDHARALETIVNQGTIGESYNVGGESERTNLQVVRGICDLLDRLQPGERGSYRDLIAFVSDRPGHDLRYAMDFSKLQNELGWRPQETFESGLEKTVRWYLNNMSWWSPILERRYAGERLGLARRVQTSSAK